MKFSVRSSITEPLAPLLSEDFQRRTERAVLWALVVLAAYLFCDLYIDVLSISTWRHDEVMMFGDYMGKLQHEGRWFNYMLFPLIRRVNPQICIAIELMCWFYFAYVVARRLCGEKLFSVFFALCMLQVPSTYAIIGWMQTTLPTFVVLALLAYLSEFLSCGLIFIIGGIWFFGGLNNFYNLLPLLYLSELRKGNAAHFIRAMLSWVAGFILGYIVCLVMTRMIGGQWGLVIEGWRHPNPVHSLADLVDNVKRVADNFNWHCRIVSRKLILVLGALACVSALCGILKAGKRGIPGEFWVLATLAMVAAAVYAQSLPMGLGVAVRTAYPLYAAIFCLGLVIRFRFRLLSSLGLAVLLTSCFLLDSDSIRHHAVITNTWKTHLVNMNTDFRLVRTVHLCSSNEDIAASERLINESNRLSDVLSEGFGVDFRFFPSLRSVGFMNHVDFDRGHCEIAKDRVRSSNQLFSWVEENREIYLWFN